MAEPRIYLHIGAMKTGTTYLQGMLGSNRDALSQAGYLFWGKTWEEQDHAVRDLLGRETDERVLRLTRGAWPRMVDDLLAYDGPSVISMEFLSFLDPERAARVVEDLSGAQLHIILTVRSAITAIPAQWQTHARNGGGLGWMKFLEGIEAFIADRDASSRGAKLFRRTQDIPRMLDTWVPLVGAERTHVVLTPPRSSDPDLLWKRFAQIIGVDPSIAAAAPNFDNSSLGHDSSELMRRINLGLGGEVRTDDYRYVGKAGLGRFILGQRVQIEPKVVLHRSAAEMAADWNRTVVESIKSQGVDLVGSLKEFPTRIGRRDHPAHPYFVDPPAMVAAADTAWEGLSALISRLHSLAGQEPEAVPPAPAWMQTDHPGNQAVHDVTELTRSAMRLHRSLTADRRFTLDQLYC
ncbi:MAG: hypothetical protein ACSLEW_08490 [Nocardioides sp.]